MLEHVPSWFDWFVVLTAILFSPVLAVFSQRTLDRIREKRERRANCYLTLMSLRSLPLHPDHIRALNSIDTIFGGKRGFDVKIREAWGKVLEHVATDSRAADWGTKLVDLRVDLYQAIGRAVGYDHSIDYIKTRIYTPQHYGDVEQEQTAIRQGMAKALTPAGLKVLVVQEAPPEGPAGRPGNR